MVPSHTKTSTDEKTVVNSHLNELPLKIGTSRQTSYDVHIGYLSFTKDCIRLYLCQL